MPLGASSGVEVVIREHKKSGAALLDTLGWFGKLSVIQ